MFCCRSNEAIIEGPTHRRRKSLGTSKIDNDDDDFSHAIDMIEIQKTNCNETNKAMIINASFVQKILADGKPEVIDGDEISELTYVTKKETSSIIYNLSLTGTQLKKKKWRGQDNNNTREDNTSSNCPQFELPQSMLNNVKEDDEYSA